MGGSATRWSTARGDLARALPYDRRELRPGIVHIGVGRFHRAHLATYLDDLFGLGLGQAWAVRGVGLRSEDCAVRDALMAQDGLFSVTEKHDDGTRSTRVVGSLLDYVAGWEDPEGAVEAIADPETKIVSLTVTEGGYSVDHQTGEFVVDDEIAADVRGSVPRTVFAVVCQGLRRRRDRGLGPVTILSCDNIEGNGVVAKRAFTTFAGAIDDSLAEWIDDEVAFPSTMVDRITPATVDDDVTELRTRTGLVDRAAVVCESFRQFVVEDEFVAGRPPWERVGVQMVDDVRPYELMKLRLLNAPHQVLAHFGILAGYTHTAEAMRDPDLVALVRAFQDLEARPTLPEIPGVDLGAYATTVLERFANPQMGDTLVRIAASASARIPAFVLPVVWDGLQSGGELALAAATVAAWVHRLVRVERDATLPTVPDEVALVSPGTASTARDVLAHPVFGELSAEPRFIDACEHALRQLEHDDIRTVMRTLVREAHRPPGSDAKAPVGSYRDPDTAQRRMQ
jgi:mannitol 2-dehydrogenase